MSYSGQAVDWCNWCCGVAGGVVDGTSRQRCSSRQVARLGLQILFAALCSVMCLPNSAAVAAAAAAGLCHQLACHSAAHRLTGPAACTNQHSSSRCGPAASVLMHLTVLWRHRPLRSPSWKATGLQPPCLLPMALMLTYLCLWSSQQAYAAAASGGTFWQAAARNTCSLMYLPLYGALVALLCNAGGACRTSVSRHPLPCCRQLLAWC
jgi:hypothetical protein